MTINEWAEDFKSYVNELQMPKDDYKGIMLYIDDALELLKELKGLTLALEQANATINYLNEEKEKAIRDIDLYIADAESDAKTPQRTGKGYSVGLGYGLLIAKEILQGIRKHG